MSQGAKVLVGMSGGVDSSVAAALLVEQGYHVVGAYMKNWTLDVPGMQCPWAEDLAYAKRTAVKLGIDLRVYDFQEAYKRDVVDYLVREYRAGRTPNPDIMCNQDVKFGLFLQTALDEGFDYIATGHYASSSVVLSNDGNADATASAGTQSASAHDGLRTEVRGALASETISGAGETLADSSTTSGSTGVDTVASAGTQSASAHDGLRTEVRGALASETILGTGETLADSSTFSSVVLANDGVADAAASSSTQSASAHDGLRTEVRGAPVSENISGTGETLADSSTASGSTGVDTVASAGTQSASAHDGGLGCVLLRAADEHKDQTYFLYRMGGWALVHTLFPLGGYTKEQVRKMAAQRGLPAAHKPDSQGICFIGEAPIQDFLRLYVSPEPGKIIDVDTHRVVGGHDGALFYTLGQRKGLGVGGGQPYYVVGKNMETNEVFVSHNPQAQDLQTTELHLQDCSWIAGRPPEPGTYLVRTRHTGQLVSAHFEPVSASSAAATEPTTEPTAEFEAIVRFDTPCERVAPGQSVVLYKDRVCLGGGIVV